MNQLPVHKVPRLGSDGARYRARQLLFQLPKQDFSPKYAKFLRDEALPSFHDLSKERQEDAVGIGEIICFDVKAPTYLYVETKRIFIRSNSFIHSFIHTNELTSN